MSRIKESCYNIEVGDYEFGINEPDDSTYNKSCFGCIHCTTWKDSGSYYQPPDSGWECTHPEASVVEPPDGIEHMSDDEFAIACAKDCLAFQAL